MTDEELKALVANISISADQRKLETDQSMKESAIRNKELDRLIRKVGKQIANIGEKFGCFTEDFALPSMSKVLRKRFKVEVILSNASVCRGENEIEYDVLAYARGSVNEVYVVEVKSHAKVDAITQIKTRLAEFKTWFPEHKDKAVYGILTAVKISKTVHEKAIKSGIYIANIHDDVFSLDVPKNFHPTAF